MRREIDPLDPHWWIRAVAITVRATLRRVLNGQRDIATQRRWVGRLASFTHAPRGLQRKTGVLGGRPAEWIAPKGRLEDPPRVLYLHGGGWVLGSPRTARPIAGGLARRLDAPVVSLDYRLAPKHPFPAAPDDVHRAYLELRDQLGPDSPIAIAGDSAGGNMSVGLAMRLRDEGRPLPSALGLISPGADFSRPRSETGADALMTAAWVNQVMDHYVAGHDPSDPRLSCALGDLTDLPPMWIQVAAQELLRPDAEQLYATAREAGVDVCLEVHDRMWHDFQMQAGLLKTADSALDTLAAFFGSTD